MNNLITNKKNKMEKAQGLPVNIYRDGYKCEINVFHDKKELTLMDVKGPFSPSESAPPVRIVRRQLWGKEYIHAEPIEKGSYAFGGSFIYTCDSRFSEISKYPIPLHDRNMSLESGSYD